MKHQCSHCGPMLERMLQSETVAPAPDDLEHVEKCAECRRAVALAATTDERLRAHFDALKTPVAPFAFDTACLGEPDTTPWWMTLLSVRFAWLPAFGLALMILGAAFFVMRTPPAPGPTRPADTDRLVCQIDGTVLGATGAPVTRILDGQPPNSLRVDATARLTWTNGIVGTVAQARFAVGTESVTLHSGRLTVKVPSGRGLVFRTRTPVATLAVRGTAYAVTVDSSGATDAEVSEGIVLVETSTHQTFSLPAGQKIHIGAAGIADQPQPIAPVRTPAPSAPAMPSPGSGTGTATGKGAGSGPGNSPTQTGQTAPSTGSDAGLPTGESPLDH